MPARSALLLGATGLVGRHCLDLLLSDDTYDGVTTLGRRPLGREHPKLTHHVIDFDNLGEYRAFIHGQDVFCSLGSTIKEAGSKAAFRKVDLIYPREIAKTALEHGAEQYLLISALGADKNSLFFYNRVKGEVEEAIRALSFYGTYILRPSLLTGDREDTRKGERAAEKLLNALSFALRGPLDKYRPIAARTVAAGMLAIARQRPGRVRIYESDQIRAVAETLNETASR